MLILTADIGEGHDLPARIIKADLEEEVPEAEVEIANGLEAMGKISAAVLRNGSKVTFRWMPWLFDIQYWLITKFAPTRWLFHHLGYLLGARGLLRLIDEHDPDVVISTYPGVTAVLGMLRENRRLDDPGAVGDHRPRRAALLGPSRASTSTTSPTRSRSRRSRGWSARARVEWVRPPISRDFLMPRTRRDAREALDVPAHARIVLVSGGGWGIGDLEGAIDSALSDDDTLVVCITGRNEVAREKLEQRFGGNEQVRILGFTEQMSDWMAAADAMIHATAGLTVLEAHIRGCPVVSYGFSAGHLRANNAAFERFGLAEVARSEHELESVLRHVTRERRSPDSSFASLPSIASRVLTVRPRVRPQPVWRLRTERVAAGGQPSPLIAGRDAARRDPPREPPTRWSPSRSRAASTSARTTTRPPARRRRSRRRSTPQPQPTRRAAAAALDRPRCSGPAPSARPRSLHAGPGAGAGRAGARRRRSGSSCARTGAEGVALTFDDGPHPQGTPAVLEILREARRPGDLLPRRRAGRAAAGAGGRDRRRRPPGRAALPPPPQPAAAERRAQLLDDAERGRAAIEEASGQAIADYRPPYGIFSAAGLRAIRAARLAAGALVAVGEGLDAAARPPSSIARRATAGVRGRRHPAPARRRLLQRAAAPGCAPRRRCRSSSRSSRAAG